MFHRYLSCRSIQLWQFEDRPSKFDCSRIICGSYCEEMYASKISAPCSSNLADLSNSLALINNCTPFLPMHCFPALRHPDVLCTPRTGSKAPCRGRHSRRGPGFLQSERGWPVPVWSTVSQRPERRKQRIQSKMSHKNILYPKTYSFVVKRVIHVKLFRIDFYVKGMNILLKSR